MMGLHIYIFECNKVNVTYPDTKIVCEGVVEVIHITSYFLTV